MEAQPVDMQDVEEMAGDPIPVQSLRSALQFQAMEPIAGLALVTRAMVVNHAGALLEVYARLLGTMLIEEGDRVQHLGVVDNLLVMCRDGYLTICRRLLL